jgi:hypothetical protein
MKDERITKQQLNDIDLDVYSAMREMPNNDNYNAMYIRWAKEENDLFVRLLCNVEDVGSLLGILMFTDKGQTPQPYVEPAENAFLNLAISVLKEKSEDEVSEFINVLRDVRAGQTP